MAEAYIIDAVRTPRGVGKPGKGALSHLHPQHLAATVLAAIRDRNKLDTATVDDIVWSTSSQNGKQGGDLGRMAALSAGFKAYVSGGHLQFNTPVDLAGATARMTVKDKVGGHVLHSLTTENGGIDIDAAAYSITLNISATDTETFAWKGGVYDLEVVQGAVVTALLSGKVTVSKEVTT